MINRKEEIKKKGFKMSFVDSTSNSETQNSFVPVDFSKIKIGAKTLEDAILDLGNYGDDLLEFIKDSYHCESLPEYLGI